MRYLVGVLVLFFAMGLIGCPTPESYIKATELAVENSANLDKNVEVVASNYFKFIAQDTKKKVEAGEMNAETREAILKDVKTQVSNIKEQSIINREFVKLAHDWVHSKGLKPEEMLAVIKTINEATPEVLKFIDKLKGD